MRNFTDSWIRTLKPHKQNRLEYRETGSRGFVLRVTPNGTKTFYTYYKIDRGTARKIKLGNYPTLSLEKARIKHLELRALISQKIDPYKSKEEKVHDDLKTQREIELKHKSERTVNELVKDYISESKEQKTKTVNEIYSIFKKYLLPKYGHLKTSEITSFDIKDIINKHRDDILKRKLSLGKDPVAIGHEKTHEKLHALLNFGIKEGFVKSNPAFLQKPRINKAFRNKRRCLTDDEIATYWWGTDKLPAARQTQIAIKLLLVLGQRQSQLVRAKKSEFDLENKLWTAPPASTKTVEWAFTPLPDIAIELIKEQTRLFKPFDSVFLFPNRDFSKHMNSDVLTQAFGRGVNKGIFPSSKEPTKYFTLYYARHTFRSNLSRLGYPKDYAERILNHSQHNIDRVYDHYAYANELREMMNSWGRLLTNIIYNGNTNVIKIRARAN